jgi:iron complex outermembrane receptor protein
MKFNYLFLASLALFARVVPVHAQQAPTTTPAAPIPTTTPAGPIPTTPPAAPIQLPQVTVTAPNGGYAATPVYSKTHAYFGPLGNQPIKDTPFSMTVIPEDLIVNAGLTGVNQALAYLPSVEVRDQQGDEVSRPQSRGFMGGIFQNTRLDGMNIIGTTAIPTENLSGIEVLNGLASALYGPETAAGVFNYTLKRPTDTPLYRFIESYDSTGVWTEAADISGRVGPDGLSPDGAIGYRFNFVHGEGQSTVSDSNVNRTLFSGDFDFHIDPNTVVELDLSHYETDSTGLAGAIGYGAGKSTILPAAVNPNTLGLGQPGAGDDLSTNTVALKVKHQFNADWSGEVGALYQNADRSLFGIEDTMQNNAGEYNAYQGWTAAPGFNIASWTASLNGHFNVLGMKNDLSIGANGFSAGEDAYVDPKQVLLGTSNLSDPTVFGTAAAPNWGGEYQSATVSEQSLTVGDTLHITPQWALQGVLSTSFINAKSFNASGKTTSTDQDNGVLSPTVALTYKPTSAVTAYASFSDSVEEGDQATATDVNANQFMAPYRDHEYEAGVKYAPTDSLLITADAFDMTRPLAEAVEQANATYLYQVVGTQRNIGAEVFVQGEVLPSLSVLGGVTYIDARLSGDASAALNGGLVVGVPAFKGDIALDYHPTFAEGFGFTGAVHYESSRAASDTNYSYAPSYVTLDLGVRYSTALMFKHHVTARLQMLNVTNRYYYVSVADTSVGAAGSNTAFLGAPRTLMGSLEFDF